MKRRQAGFSLVTAVFLMVVVAALGTFMVTIGSTQRQTAVLSVQGARALAAADSGMDWAIADVLGANACFASPTTFTLGGGAIANFSVTNACAASSYTEGANAYNVFALTSTASYGAIGNADYISRSVRSTVTTAP